MLIAKPCHTSEEIAEGTERENLKKLFEQVKEKPTHRNITTLLIVAWYHTVKAQGFSCCSGTLETPEAVRCNLSRLCNHLILVEEILLFLKSLHLQVEGEEGEK